MSSTLESVGAMAREPEAIAKMRRALGERLAAFRRAADLKQAQLASEAACDRTNVSHIENGRSRADERFWQIADSACHANGVLLAAFHELEAARAEHDREVHETAVVQARAKVALLRPSDRSAEVAESSIAQSPAGDPAAHSVVNLLGPNDALDTVDRFTGSIIARYELEGPHRLVAEARELRRICQRLGPAVSGTAEREHLVRASARQSALLAYMSVNLSRYSEAERYALEASILATAAKDQPLLAWIKGTQSFAAYYQKRYDDALNLARVGVQLAGNDGQRIRLLSNGVARAAGKLGDHRAVERAASEALELVQARPGPTGMTPCIDFASYGWARTAANVATAYLSVGRYDRALRLTQSLATIVDKSDSDWSRSLVRLDEASALTMGRAADLEHAAKVGINALAASADKPIVSIHTRAFELAASLRRHGPNRAGQEFSLALREWQQRGSGTIK